MATCKIPSPYNPFCKVYNPPINRSRTHMYAKYKRECTPRASRPSSEWICPRCRKSSRHATSSDKRWLFLRGIFTIVMTTTLSWLVIRRQIHGKAQFDGWITRRFDNKSHLRQLKMEHHICTRPTNLVVMLFLCLLAEPLTSSKNVEKCWASSSPWQLNQLQLICVDLADRHGLLSQLGGGGAIESVC